MSFSFLHFLKGGGGFLLGSMLSKMLQFLFIILGARILAPKDFGVLCIGLSILVIITEATTISLSLTIMRFYSATDKDANQRLWSSILLFSFIFATIIWVSIFYGAHFIGTTLFNEPELVAAIRALSFSVFPLTLFNIIKALMQAQQRVSTIVLLDSTQKILWIIFFCVVILLFHSFSMALYAISIANVLSTLSFLIIIKRYFPVFSVVKLAKVAPLLSYGTPALITGLGLILAANTDRFLLGRLANVTQAGYYTLITYCTATLMFIHIAFATFFRPLTATAFNTNKIEDARAIYLFMNKWISICNGLLLIILALYGTEILTFIGLKEVSNITYVTLLVLSLYYFLATWVGPSGVFLQMTNGYKLETLNTLLFLLCTIGFNFLFIPHYGILGAAIGTFCAGFVRNLLQIIQMIKFHGFVPFKKQHIYISILALTGVMFAVYFHQSNIAYKALFILIYIIIYAVSVIKTLSVEDKALYSTIRSKLKARYQAYNKEAYTG